MAAWEYAEVAWHPLYRGRSRAEWCGPDGHRELKVHGVEALNQAVRAGWEVVEYKTAETWSSCLLRRPLK
jgi:hypothetical protein